VASSNYYDVTEWRVGNPHEDIGQVINSILADIKTRQNDSDVKQGGKPGAVIYLPPGDYRLRTQVVIDLSFLKIMGSGHGFTSSSIRFNTPEAQWPDLHELWPGGSRILVDLPQGDERDGSGFLRGTKREPADQFGGVFELLHRRPAFRRRLGHGESRKHLRQR